MIKNIFIIFISFPFFYGFNWKRCDSYMSKHVPVGVSMSTTGFTSSFGPCSMLGRLNHDSKVFVAHNFNQMEVDFARGRGEYARAFASMYGCNQKGQNLFPILIKSKFGELSNQRENLENVHKILVDEIQNHPAMITNCSEDKKG
jgi:Protein of unknown function (DUF3015)